MLTVFKILAMASMWQLVVCRFFNGYCEIKRQHFDGDAGDPLFLTPYIESGKIDIAQNLSTVGFTEGWFGIKSYSGFFTVNKKYNSNQFFWYFPPLSNAENAPVVLWLQGGPGGSSLFGLFAENGPIEVKDKKIRQREYNWALNHHVIYIDNPVGTGFSFTNASDGYAKDEVQVGRELYNSMLQFFKLFPHLQKNSFYVTGESYAGKYVPALSYTIHKENPTADLKINLVGFAIGNGLSDPVHQMEYGKYLNQLGLIDSSQMAVFDAIKEQGIEYIKAKKWADAFRIFDNLLNGDLIYGKSLFFNDTGLTYYYNYIQSSEAIDTDEFVALLNKNAIRNQVHVGNLPFNDGHEVEINLMEDVMQSVAPWVSELLSHYKGLIYNGQLDIIVAYPLTINYLQNLDFSAADEYKTAKRHIWQVDGEVAGYAKVAGNLTEVLVRDAGHMVPSDQPKWALDLISRFTHNKPFFKSVD